MTHQVLARKWRPRDFASLVGQDHVVRALTHALDSGRLHHAYLFTGTRGVGKTTIARILAKSLNCEVGVSARPCGRCRACVEIDEGRFPDYLELDAASNRGVDEMAQLLENAVYAPVSGRFKVYVIDEVHMLSTHAFNAMLKTLEEPPPHVTFILATTDPQKVPVTVLSRCLQFSLKNMPPASVAAHLGRVLEAEGIPGEPASLALIGRAAAGSMRDALSLLDQAIAFSAGSVDEASVREMLGVVDRRYLSAVLDALIAGDGPALIAVADEMLSNNAPFSKTLSDLAALMQRIALAQFGASGEVDDVAALERYAGAISAEDLQVWYQILIHGANDLPLAPDEHAGFTMTLLRMLAFRPRESLARPQEAPVPRTGTHPAGAAIASASRPAEQPTPRPTPAMPAESPQPRPEPRSPAPAGKASERELARAENPVEPATRAASPVPRRPVAGFDGDWPALATQVSLGGLAQQFLQQSQLLEHDGLSFRLRVPIRPLAEPAVVSKVRDALTAHFGAPVRITAEVGSVAGPTAAAAASERRAERLEQARASLEADPFVRTLLTDLDGRILPESVRPIDS